MKRDTNTGQFMDVKQDGTPFKGVTKEKIIFLFVRPILYLTLKMNGEMAVLWNLRAGLIHIRSLIDKYDDPVD